MLDKDKLYSTLDKIDSKGYRAYKRIRGKSNNFGDICARCPDPESINPGKGRKIKVKPRGIGTLQTGKGG
ncbi:MAG: hypothetical protein ACOC21_01550 [Halanaerobiales bacterium]